MCTSEHCLLRVERSDSAGGGTTIRAESGFDLNRVSIVSATISGLGILQDRGGRNAQYVHCPESSHGDDVDRPTTSIRHKRSRRTATGAASVVLCLSIHPLPCPKGSIIINIKKEDSHQKNPPERRSGLARTPYQDQKPETRNHKVERNPYPVSPPFEPGTRGPRRR